MSIFNKFVEYFGYSHLATLLLCPFRRKHDTLTMYRGRKHEVTREQRAFAVEA